MCSLAQCAQQELGRIQEELEKPQTSTAPGVRGNKAEKGSEPPSSIRNHDQIAQDILAQHGIKDKDSNAKEKVVAEAVANATTEAVKTASNSNDMVSSRKRAYFSKVMSFSHKANRLFLDVNAVNEIRVDQCFGGLFRRAVAPWRLAAIGDVPITRDCCKSNI